MTRVALTAVMHNAIKSSFSFLLGFFPLHCGKGITHVEPLLHQSFTIVEALAGGSRGSDGAEEEVGGGAEEQNRRTFLFDFRFRGGGDATTAIRW